MVRGQVEEEEEKSSKGGFILIAIVVVIFLLVVAAGGIYFWMQRKQKEIVPGFKPPVVAKAARPVVVASTTKENTLSSFIGGEDIEASQMKKDVPDFYGRGEEVEAPKEETTKMGNKIENYKAKQGIFAKKGGNAGQVAVPKQDSAAQETKSVKSGIPK